MGRVDPVRDERGADPLRRGLGEAERAARPVYAVLLAIAGVLALLVDPVMCLVLVALFGLAALLQKRG